MYSESVITGTNKLMFLSITSGSLLERDCQIGSVNAGKNTSSSVRKAGVLAPAPLPSVSVVLVSLLLSDMLVPHAVNSSVHCFYFCCKVVIILRDLTMNITWGSLRSRNSFV